MGCVYVKQYMFHGLRCAMCTRFVVPGCAMRTLHVILFQAAYITCYFVLSCVHYMLFCSRLRTLHVILFQVAYITCYFVLGCVHYMLFCSRLRTLHVILFQVAYITCCFVLGCVHYMLFCSRLRTLHVILFQIVYITCYFVLGCVNYMLFCSRLRTCLQQNSRILPPHFQYPSQLRQGGPDYFHQLQIRQIDTYIVESALRKNVTGNKVLSFRFLRLFSLKQYGGCH